MSMIELSLLGLHALRGPDGRELTSLPAQPKRFALLAYLALGGRGGYHRRDTLAALFWPEMDQFAARRALRNTLYHLREALGDNVIVTRGDEAVSINPAMLTCDVTLLHDAFDAGRYEEVVDRCHGELLAGIHFVSAGEAYEEWLSRERAEIGALVMRALGALVERERGAGNIAAAAHWAQRACTLDVRDEVWLREAMSLLDQADDTGSALRVYDSYTSRLAVEFDAKPSATTVALAAAIREGGHKAAAAPVQRPLTAGNTADATPVAATEGIVVMPVRHRTGGRRTMGWAIVAGVVAVVAIVVARALNVGPARGADARTRVLVETFDNRTGDAALQSLGRMTQDWLAQGILHTNLVDVVDPRAVFVQSHPVTGGTVDPITLAHRTGASMVVSGSFYRADDTLFFQATVMDVRTGRIVRVVGPVRSPATAPLAGLDELRSRVMTALASVVDVRANETFTSAGEIPTFDAYQAYVEGSDAFWHGDRRRAESLFLQAAQRDTMFAAAAIAAATTAGNVNDCAVIDSIAHALDARSQPLERVDRLTLQIAVARCRGRNDEMLRLALERADLEPRAADVQLSAAAAALWADRPQRALELLKRIDPAVDFAWSTDTAHFNYWSDLTEAYHRLGRHADELAAANRVAGSAPLSRAWMRGRALAALSRPTAALAVIDSSLVLPVETANVGLAPYTDGRPQYTATPAWVATWIARELAVHGDTVAARQAAQRAVAWYRSRPPEERSTMEERLVATWSLEMVGANAEAEQLARQLVAEDSTNVDFKGELAGLAAERGDTALADSLDRWLAAQSIARVSWSAAVYRARIAALLGRRDLAIARTREARDEGAWPTWIHVDSALAVLHPTAARP
jgi:DNA-binding SARP family transcriptional activator/TolB-like protein